MIISILDKTQLLSNSVGCGCDGGLDRSGMWPKCSIALPSVPIRGCAPIVPCRVPIGIGLGVGFAVVGEAFEFGSIFGRDGRMPRIRHNCLTYLPYFLSFFLLFFLTYMPFTVSSVSTVSTIMLTLLTGSVVSGGLSVLLPSFFDLLGIRDLHHL